MNGFGTGTSGFGQQGGTPQGPGLFGNQAQTPSTSSFPSLGAKRTQSFAGSSSSGTGLFGSTTPSNTTGSTGIFGSNAAVKPPLTNTTGGPFGSTGTNNALNGGGSLFGTNNNTTPGTATTNNSAFGANNGMANNGTANNATGGIFGASSTGTQGTGGSLFGNNATSNSSNSGTNLFGSQNNSSSKPLFGQGATGATPSTGLFNTSNTGTSTGGGLFGGGGSGGGIGTTGSSLFNNNNKPATGLGNTTGSGMFGSQNSTTPFGQPPSQQTQQQVPPQQPLVASIEQASYTLPGVAPSQKLYTSLSVQGVKRSAHETDAYSYDSNIPSVPRNPSIGSRFKTNNGVTGAREKLVPGVRRSGTVSVAGPLLSTSGLNVPNRSSSSAKLQGERTWINSYEKFVHERPTTLRVKRTDRKTLPRLLPAREVAPVATAPPSITSFNGSITMEAMEENSKIDDLPASADTASHNEADVSLFHRQVNNMTLVRVNKRAVEEGYYIHPRLEDLASMSKSQLASVSNLVIGRENFGQIEYPGTVDLSRIANLGDLLGTLVIFGPGTVCVYPEESSKAPPGRELNLPCTVTIENAWPKDAMTHEVIKNMEDPRMIKHIQKLRKACESRGGEFVTFTQGIWVFKVPHFSTWGLPAEEMIVEFDDGDGDGDANAGDGDAAAMEYQNFDSTKNIPTDGANQFQPKQVPENPAVDGHNDSISAQNAGEDAEVLEGDSLYVQDSIAPPHNWLDQLTHASNGVLLAAAESLEAASKSTAKLDLEDILSVSQKHEDLDMGANDKKSDSLDNSSDLNLQYFDSKAGCLRSTSFRKHIRKQSRPDSNLPLLQTLLKFSDLSSYSENNSSLWNLLSILIDDKKPELRGKDVDFSNLSMWFDSKVNSRETNFQGDALDTIWQLICNHRVNEAYSRAVTSNNIHLALLIALLDERSRCADGSIEEGDLSFDADHQLNDWKVTRTLASIPKAVRRIWELAARRIPSGAGINWSQWLGIHFWYFGDSSIQKIIGDLPSTYTTGSKELELMFLQFYAGTKQLRTAVSELDLVDSFLCLQAVFSSNPSAVKADLKFYDSICVKLAEAFEKSNDPNSAVFAALHITDSKLATQTTRKILQNAPVTVSLPLDFGVPEQFLDESRAFQVARAGEYVAQAEYLIRAGLFNDGHKIIVSRVGPEAVLNSRLDQIYNLLENLEQNKDKVTGWLTGGNVYLTYARAVSQGSDSYSVMALCNACRYAETPTLKSREAISRIAEWVASTPFAKSNIPSQMILKMKFDPCQIRTQALQEASRLLS